MVQNTPIKQESVTGMKTLSSPTSRSKITRGRRLAKLFRFQKHLASTLPPIDKFHGLMPRMDASAGINRLWFKTLKLKAGWQSMSVIKFLTLRRLIASLAQAEVKIQDQWLDQFINLQELKMETFSEAINIWDMVKKWELNPTNIYTEKSLALLVTSIVQQFAPQFQINKLLACLPPRLMPTVFGYLITWTQMSDLRCKEKLSNQESQFLSDIFKPQFISELIATLNIRMISELKTKFIAIITQPRTRVKIWRWKTKED